MTLFRQAAARLRPLALGGPGGESGILDPRQGGELGPAQPAAIELLQQLLFARGRGSYPRQRIGFENLTGAFRRCHSKSLRHFCCLLIEALRVTLTILRVAKRVNIGRDLLGVHLGIAALLQEREVAVGEKNIMQAVRGTGAGPATDTFIAQATSHDQK